MGSIDVSRLSSWFDAYSPALALYARQWLAVEPAEDVVQEVFLRLMSQSSEPGNARAWLFRSVRNAAISRMRSDHRRRRHEETVARQRLAWFESRPGDLVDAAAAETALQTLPEDQREVIVLRVWADLTFQEIAEVTGRPVSTLSSRYQSGLATLRERMKTSCKTKTT